MKILIVLLLVAVSIVYGSGQKGLLAQSFEVASVRPTGGSGGCGGLPQLNPNRFAVTNMTLYALIALAYLGDGQPNIFRCVALSKSDLISGGPDWIRRDQFTIQAVIPQGSPNYTIQHLWDGKAPILQMMIQTLLADRFKLALHHETKEVPVYALTVATGGPKLQRLEEDSCTPRVPAGSSSPPTPVPQGGKPMCGAGDGIFGAPGSLNMTVKWSSSLSEFSRILNLVLDRPVIDRTGITGMVGFQMQFTLDQPVSRLPGDGVRTSPVLPPEPAGPSIFTAMQEQIGLKLEPIKGPVEVIIIDHAERPSEN